MTSGFLLVIPEAAERLSGIHPSTAHCQAIGDIAQRRHGSQATA